MPRRHREGKHRAITGAQRTDLWLGSMCNRDHPRFGEWCACSPFSSPADRERAFWSLPEEERRHLAALADYDERFREAREEAERTDRDVVLIHIERGILTTEELARIVAVAGVSDSADPVLVERAEAARKALSATPAR
jgi:hypothetical protein